MKLKICTFNLRTDNKADGINAFPLRTGRILETIRAYAPDIIGLQEVKPNMRAWLREALTEYCVVGCGRDRELKDESMTIAYRRDAFEMLWLDNFWLSATPDVPGSRYGFDQSHCPRMASAICLRHDETGRVLVFCNTHLDHVGKTARLFGSMQILQYLSTKPYPFILTGDFNAHPDAPEITLLTSVPDFPVSDVTAGLGGTFHGFGRLTEKEKIDYIFTNLPYDPADAFVVPDEGVDGVYISDHHPVVATVEI